MLNESFSSHTVVSSIVTKGLQNLLNLPSMLLEILSAYIDSEHLDHISWHWPPCCSFIWKRHVAPCFLRSPCRQSHQCSVKHSLPTSSPLALSLSLSLSYFLFHPDWQVFSVLFSFFMGSPWHTTPKPTACNTDKTTWQLQTQCQPPFKDLILEDSCIGGTITHWSKPDRHHKASLYLPFYHLHYPTLCFPHLFYANKPTWNQMFCLAQVHYSVL